MTAAPASEKKAEEIARGLTKPMRTAMEYYALAHVHPKDCEKLYHPANYGWGSRTIDNLIDRGILQVGPGGWHVFTPLGHSVAAYLRERGND